MRACPGCSSADRLAAPRRWHGHGSCGREACASPPERDDVCSVTDLLSRSALPRRNGRGPEVGDGLGLPLHVLAIRRATAKRRRRVSVITLPEFRRTCRGSQGDTVFTGYANSRSSK